MLLSTMTTKFVTAMKPDSLETAKGKKKKGKRIKVTDMRVCPTCHKVWSYYHDGNKIRFRAYTDIPKYGLPRQQCPICEETK